jgi:hypothetical protein
MTFMDGTCTTPRLSHAAALKEVINIFGIFKAVHPGHADSLSTATLRGVLPSFRFYRARTLTSAELAVAIAAQASHDRMISHTHDARTSSKPANIKLKARWVGGGQEFHHGSHSTSTVTQDHPCSHRVGQEKTHSS